MMARGVSGDIGGEPMVGVCGHSMSLLLNHDGGGLSGDMGGELGDTFGDPERTTRICVSFAVWLMCVNLVAIVSFRMKYL